MESQIFWTPHKLATFFIMVYLAYLEYIYNIFE